MPLTVAGALSTAAVHPGDKFRATWLLVASQVGLPVNAPALAQKIREALPALGFYAVSAPSAVMGDKVVVFDIRSTGSFPGRTVADVATRLDQLPALAGGWASNLQALVALALSGSTYKPGGPPPSAPGGSAEQEQALEEARQDGNETAAAGSWIDQLMRGLKTAGLVTVAAAAVVFFVVVRGKSKDW